jgi:hypothetical protein
MKMPPKTYRLGAHTAKIIVVDGLSKRATDPSWGLCDVNTYDIYLAKEHAAPHLMASTLLHELGHSILSINNIELKDKLEERIVDAFATWMLGLIKDNPKLLKWIADATK